MNRPESLQGLKKWWDEFKTHAPVPDNEAEDFCCVVVGNKIDLAQAETDIVENENRQAETLLRRKSGIRVSEADAERFLEELVPYSNTSVWPDLDGDDNDDGYDLSSRNTMNDDVLSRQNTGLLSRPISGFSLRPVRTNNEVIDGVNSGSPTKTQSISIQARNNLGKRVEKSRSSERSQFGGTVTTTRTGYTIYHTPSSSLFDRFESAPSSPFHGSMGLPSSYSSMINSPPTTPERQRILRRQPSSLSSSAPTITPSLFMRGQVSASSSAAPTPPTPDTDENQSDYPFSVLHSRRQNAPCLPPKPERRPRLFLASAKTGVGVEPIFEYIARRVAMRWTYAEALEARIVHTNAAMNNTVRLTATKPRTTSLRERWAVSENSCCGA